MADAEERVEPREDYQAGANFLAEDEAASQAGNGFFVGTAEQPFPEELEGRIREYFTESKNPHIAASSMSLLKAHLAPIFNSDKPELKLILSDIFSYIATLKEQRRTSLVTQNTESFLALYSTIYIAARLPLTGTKKRYVALCGSLDLLDSVNDTFNNHLPQVINMSEVASLTNTFALFKRPHTPRPNGDPALPHIFDIFETIKNRIETLVYDLNPANGLINSRPRPFTLPGNNTTQEQNAGAQTSSASRNDGSLFPAMLLSLSERLPSPTEAWNPPPEYLSPVVAIVRQHQEDDSKPPLLRVLLFLYALLRHAESIESTILPSRQNQISKGIREIVSDTFKLLSPSHIIYTRQDQISKIIRLTRIGLGTNEPLPEIQADRDEQERNNRLTYFLRSTG